MPTGFMNLSFHAADAAQQDVPRQLEALGPAAAAMFGPQTDLFGDDESAARFYLAQEMGLDARPAMQAFMGADGGALDGTGAPSLVPNLDPRRRPRRAADEHTPGPLRPEPGRHPRLWLAGGGGDDARPHPGLDRRPAGRPHGPGPGVAGAHPHPRPGARQQLAARCGVDGPSGDRAGRRPRRPRP